MRLQESNQGGVMIWHYHLKMIIFLCQHVPKDFIPLIPLQFPSDYIFIY